MATIKSYTDLQQSKKLAEILPLKSADMFYRAGNETQPTFRLHSYGHIMYDKDIPCWSLASLFCVLPEIDDTSIILEKVKAEDGYDGYYYHIEYKDKILIPYSKNPIDACVTMIEKLHELNLL